MNRKQFIESVGATCNTWRNSWSFINESEKIIIFGAWDDLQENGRSLIISEDWQVNETNGRKSPAYKYSRENITLLESGEYRLKIFKQFRSKGVDDDATSKISHIEPILSDAVLEKDGPDWYAIEHAIGGYIPEEVDPSKHYKEGAVKSLKVNAYERNRVARQVCLDHHGYDCNACGFNFETVYG